ncbi:MAG: protease modulator HflC [Candidatus Marinimicrobia bacterium]|nr:protease modulator HflC [Candidatus Neomarinimicrobiota bacterium]|tara:strand:- start:3323 stop:4210 length:888 start_codon:yes stop_codon:yes gene_type:complete
MEISKAKIILLSVLAAILIILSNALYIVSEKQQAVVFQFGNPVDVSIDPGLYFKVPFIQNVMRFEKRILEWDGDPTVIPMAGDMFISVDTFARWVISDPEMFYKSVMDVSGAQSRLDDIINGVVKDKVPLATLEEIVSYTGMNDNVGRLNVMSSILEEVKRTLIGKNMGIEVVDVQIKRIDYSETVQANVFKKIISEQQVKAEKLRSEGIQIAREIEGKVEFEKKKITSEAYSTSEKIKGEGDAIAAEIYAKTYGKDTDFYNFIKSLETYENTIDKKTQIILSTKNNYFKLLQSK